MIFHEWAMQVVHFRWITPSFSARWAMSALAIALPLDGGPDRDVTYLDVPGLVDGERDGSCDRRRR